MNVAETLRGLARRWYIVVPGLVVAVALAVGAWMVVKPTYERSGSQLLVPGVGSFAPYTGNPFLNLAGLDQAVDVVVDVMNSDDVAGRIMEEHPGALVTVSRDPLSSGPTLLFTVTARSDADARQVLRLMIDQTATVVDQLQEKENIGAKYRIQVMQVAIDNHSTLSQKPRLKAAAGAGLGFGVFTVLLAALVDGLARARRGRRHGEGIPSGSPAADESEHAPEEFETSKAALPIDYSNHEPVRDGNVSASGADRHRWDRSLSSDSADLEGAAPAQRR